MSVRLSLCAFPEALARVTATLALTAIGSLGLACTPAEVASSDDGGASNDASAMSDGTSPASTQACSDYAYAYCGQLQSCSPTAMQLRYKDVPTCEVIYRALCMNGQTAPGTGASPATTEACVAAIPKWTCADFLNGQNTPPGCQEATGSRANGAPCSTRQQCQSGFCGFSPGIACGTCQPLPQVGASCVTTQCPSGLQCNAASQTCVSFAQVGASCGTTQPCNAGLTCVGATNTSAGQCQAGQTTNGGACSFAGAGCDLNSALTCNAQSATCVVAQLATAGQACGQVENQLAYCAAGNCIRGACVANIPIGGACDLDGGTPCFDSTRCVVTGDSGTSGVCQINGTSVCP